MALSPCNTTVDASQKELVDHGTSMFPIACYHDDLSQGEVPWHWHDEWEAVVVSEGICTVAAGKEQYVIRKGVLCCASDRRTASAAMLSWEKKREIPSTCALSSLRTMN